MKPGLFCLAAGLAIGLPHASLADDLMAAVKASKTNLGFDLKGDYSNLTLSLSGPDDFSLSASAKRGAPSIDLARIGDLPDGAYSYELTAATAVAARSLSKLDDGRDPDPDVAPRETMQSVTMSGTFTVMDGAIVLPSEAAKPTEDGQDPK
jgi:hypothetical protein